MIGRAALLALALAAAKDDPLAGRVAGKPVDCIDLDFVQGPRIEGRAILYPQNRRRVWRTEPVGACLGLERFATLIVDVQGKQLCRNDRFQVLRPSSRIPLGWCRMGAFTPYDRP